MAGQGGAVARSEVKVVLLGNAGVGKTSVLKRCTTGTFTNQSVPTLGASYVQKLYVIGSGSVLLQIWDTAGDERYSGMSGHYVHGARIALLVYSIDDRRSFEAIRGWHNTVALRAEAGVILFLVGNKVDLDDGDRAVSVNEGQALAGELGASFTETSAKTGHGVDELFSDIAKAFLERAQPERHGPESVRLGPDSKPAGKCC